MGGRTRGFPLNVDGVQDGESQFGFSEVVAVVIAESAPAHGTTVAATVAAVGVEVAH